MNMIKQLRENMSSIYNVRLNCDPKNVDEFVQTVENEIKKIQVRELSQESIDRGVINMYTSQPKEIKLKNRYIMNNIIQAYFEAEYHNELINEKHYQKLNC